MSLSTNAWKQIKNKSADNLISALIKDGFSLDVAVRTERVYRHPDGRRVSIHYHTGSTTYGPGLLKALLEDTQWSEKGMRRLKLIK
jgi:predicted RNA binding protein YcfA (HicA-like mRNA interferase family)